MNKKAGIVLRDLLLDALETYREDNDDDEEGLLDLVAEEIKQAKEGILFSPDLPPDIYYLEDDDTDMLERLAAKYTIEMCSLIPDASERAAKLFTIIKMKKVDSVLERYLEEACRCYIYGFFLAALIMCRGSIEYSLKKYLGIIENDKRYSIYFLLDEAKKKCDTISEIDVKLARNIYSEASSCIHGRSQTDSDECFDHLNYTKIFIDKLFLEAS